MIRPQPMPPQQAPAGQGRAAGMPPAGQQQPPQQPPQGPQQPPQQPPQGRPQQQPPQEGEDLNPQVEALYQQAAQYLYSESVFDEIMKVVKSTKAVQDAVANGILKVLEITEKKAGEQRPEILLGAALRLILESLDLLGRAGIDIKQEDVQGTIQKTLTIWLKQNPGRVTPEELQQLQQALAGGLDVEQPQVPEQGLMEQM